MKKIKNLFDPKEMIVKNITAKLKEENISKLLLVFSLHNDKYSADFLPIDSDKKISFDLEPEDTSMIKKVFVNKLKRKIENVEDYENILLLIDTKDEDFNLYLNDKIGNVTKFNF